VSEVAYNSAFGVGAGRWRRRRSTEPATPNQPHRNNATNPAPPNPSYPALALRPSHPGAQSLSPSPSGPQVPRHEVELQAHLTHLFVVDHRGVPGVIDVQLHLAAPAPQRRHIILDLTQWAARVVPPG